MPGLWERLAGGERGRLETSDCESLGSASGSEGGECRLPGRETTPPEGTFVRALGSLWGMWGSLRGWEVRAGP